MADKKKKDTPEIPLTGSKVKLCQNCLTKVKSSAATVKSCPACRGKGRESLGLI